MDTNNQFAELSKETSKKFAKTMRELQSVAITTEERVRQRIRSSVRIVIASALFCISGIVSLGVNVGVALASKTSHHSSGHKAKHHKHSHRHWKTLSTDQKIVRSDFSRGDFSESALTPQTKESTGKASWYGGKFQHRKTASGGTFDTRTLTAAHRTLPFGTKVRVTNTDNNKSCVVEITDRGPFVGSRIIDLSYAAADELGFAELGTANVHIEVIGSLADQLTAQNVTAGLDAAFVTKYP